MKKIILALYILSLGINLHAMGNREQGVLVGAAGVILLDAFLNNHTPHQQEVIYVEPRPVVVYENHYYRHHHRPHYERAPIYYDNRYYNGYNNGYQNGYNNGYYNGYNNGYYR